MLNTNLTLMKRSIYHLAIECSCGLHTWPQLLQPVCKYKYKYIYCSISLTLPVDLCLYMGFLIAWRIVCSRASPGDL